MSRAPDRTKSLDELDPPAWREPTHDSYLVRTCHRLRTKPLDDFTAADLGVMIGQEICPAYPELWLAHPRWRERLLAVLASLTDVPEEVREAVALFRARAG
jgi:hypothetical protein